MGARGGEGGEPLGAVPHDVRPRGPAGGRGGKDTLPTTDAPGEVLRVGVSLSCLSTWGHEQDYKINWPASLMFSDPTRSCPFAFGE